jgi:hypothetical protein
MKKIFYIITTLCLCIFILSGCTKTVGHFEKTGALNQPRRWHTATLLPDGNILITGGVWRFKTLTSVELYLTKEGKFIDAGNLKIDRDLHTATLLPNGDVLIMGGSSVKEDILRMVERQKKEKMERLTLRNSETGEKMTLSTYHKKYHDDLYKSEPEGDSVTQDVELYNPKTRTSKIVGHLKQKYKVGSTAILMPNGKIFIYGSSKPYAEIYNPKTNTSKLTSQINYARSNSSIVLLKDGKILITGGDISPYSKGKYNHTLKPYTLNGIKHSAGETTSTAEIYDPRNNKFNLVGNMNYQRSNHCAILLPNGQILIAGGERSRYYNPTLDKKSYDENVHPKVKQSFQYGDLRGYIQDIELFNPRTNKFKVVGKLKYDMGAKKLNVLDDRYILAIGGIGKTEEIIDIKDFKTYPTSRMIEKRAGTATKFDENKVLIVGGYFHKEIKKNTAEIFEIK